jgi:hypothetical protein
VVDFCLRHDEKNKVSLSWHLTQLEKRHVLGSIKFEENVKSMERVVKMITE